MTRFQKASKRRWRYISDRWMWCVIHDIRFKEGASCPLCYSEYRNSICVEDNNNVGNRH